MCLATIVSWLMEHIYMLNYSNHNPRNDQFLITEMTKRHGTQSHC